MIAKGWQDTVIGLLSPEQIQEAGLRYNIKKIPVYCEELKKEVFVQRGYDSVPVDEYIEEKTDDPSRPRGSKYIGPSRQFLAFMEKRKKWGEEENTDDYIDKEMVRQATPKENEIDVNKIIF